MAFWGIALAMGPCLNLDVDPPHEKAAYEAVPKALSLAPGAAEREHAYIQALAKRYSSDPKVDLRKLDAEYANATRELSKHYPDDLDAATLYAKSLMDLHPWKPWSPDVHPTEGTELIVAVLESVLRRDPNHLGANHTTFTPRKRRPIPSGPSRAQVVWKLSHLLPGIWYICRRMPICVSETIRQQPTAMRLAQMLTAYISERAAQLAACTT
jgi:hypothetical protein